MNYSAKIISVFCLTVLLVTVDIRAGEIHEAVIAGDLNRVRALIEADSTLLESKDNDGDTPLIKACLNKQTRTRQPAIAKFLIDKGADVNVKSNDGFTALLGACAGSGPDFNLVQDLIAKGAEVNARRNNDGYIPLTPLQSAAIFGDLKTAKFLIDHGADINVCDSVSGNTILQMAIPFAPNGDMAKLLVESGAKLNRKDALGNTELHLAVMKGFADLVPFLVKYGADVQTVNKNNHTALYYAAKHGYRKAADALIAAGAKESAILEMNYGKAPQLSEALRKGESYLWSLSGGYAIKTRGHLLFFGLPKIGESPEAGLANGQLNPNELAGQHITVFTHFPEMDFIIPRVLRLAKLMPEVEWVFHSNRPIEINADKKDIPSYHLAASNKNLSVGDMQVHTVAAITDITDMGYLIEADGVKLFYGAGHVSTNEPLQVERYRKEIDFLEPFGPIDIAILNVNGHYKVAYEPYLYLLNQLAPKAIYLMGGEGSPGEYPKCADVLRARNIPVKYPECGRVLGDQFHYLRDETQK